MLLCRHLESISVVKHLPSSPSTLSSLSTPSTVKGKFQFVRRIELQVPLLLLTRNLKTDVELLVSTSKGLRVWSNEQSYELEFGSPLVS